MHPRKPQEQKQGEPEARGTGTNCWTVFMLFRTCLSGPRTPVAIVIASAAFERPTLLFQNGPIWSLAGPLTFWTSSQLRLTLGVCMLSCVQLIVTPRTVACQTPLSMGSPGKNISVSCHFIFQGIFLTQESILHLLPWQVGSLPLSPQGSPPV